MPRKTDAELLTIWQTRPADVGAAALTELRRRYADGETDDTADLSDFDQITEAA